MPPAEDDDDDKEANESGEGQGGAADGFAGSLLVAHPGLRDPNFRRGVLYLTAHDREEGAMGIILNRPLLGKTAADLLPDHEAAADLARIPVYLGGPVGRDQLTFGALRLPDGGVEDTPRPGREEVGFRHHLPLPEALALAREEGGTAATEAGTAVGDHHEGRGGLRAFVGYAGWAGGQLEGEIEASAWVLVPPRARFFAPGPRTGGEDRAWFRVMSTLGPVYKLLAAVPDDLSLN